MKTTIANLTEQHLPDFIRARRHLHQHPELSWQERETSRFIRHWLEECGIELRIAKDFYATLGIIRGKQAGPVVGLRADIDALPIMETSEVPYRSHNPGVMHACGHDGHTAVLLGTARVLARLREQLPGTVVCVFQPAEENGGGGRKLIASGLLEDLGIQAFFGLHAWPYLPVGTIGVRHGEMMAAIDDFKIVVQGKSGHAAHPLAAIDPVWISAQIINAVQGLVTRERHGADPVVISIATIHGGTADNVIPAQVEMTGTMRTLKPETRERMNRRLVELVQSVARAFGGAAQVELEPGYPSLINDERMVRLVVKAATDLLGAHHVIFLDEPSMGGEDFAYYLQKYSGAFFRLGVGPRPALHADSFDFNDEALAIGVNMMAGVAVDFLRGRPAENT
ncbi:MAG: M20 family metallopeptidase [candidate division KSB1 bacterium]|nr:M20 family metallopeptidase [candidate division KSB1 bacterium]MDZ7273211.1 M20 family metallopeptidase [candidate division KSB1 bacterium]MDZ7285313.1 M20 family metallopeptidase [candidate division KSB1 bacterium]MDZ7298345.1 M20 family metallopeptidase [candidate division KSB1 bacterium]MDZ7349022.1 M20 family metallopeptidase [candidate division KSB1 bacterium]